MYQFFVEESQIEGKTVIVSGADYHHMRNVLRLKAGEEVAAVSGDLEYRCEVSEYDDKTEEAKLTVRFIKEDNVELP
ncbi:MAG: 16S rRNA methyltransferase, partial [Lachnospiraceae bacterium]|nr:16S rRNA methyltransferase [Lachnospiraceae bacterium]